MSKLTGKTAIITGGGSGIGRAISETFAAAGANVAIFDLDETAGKSTESEINGRGESAAFFPCNVADFDSVKEAVNGAESRFGSIDILVNNAGIAHIGTVETTSPEDFDRIINVNIKGVYHCLHTAIPKMLAKKSGVILNMSSVAAIAGLPDRFAYSTSKGAVHTMTFSVAADYIKDGIRCNCICPARVHTPFVDGYLEKNYPDNKEEMFEKLSAAQPIGRMALPNEVAEMALYLCCDDSGFITGQAFPLDGGYMNIR
ncbi:MAG: SDR family NAD(P)-dependent oxidoreductase [Verrucomicrobiales bacterium]|nr:SDR family NAD(P)-dependent oxidoreductase [Verrucomicrobiales bacterium]